MDSVLQLKKFRKHAGYTQKQVAEKLGISQNNYSYWEQGKVKVSSLYLEKLAKIFNCSVENLLGINKDEKIKIEKCVDFEFEKEIEMINFIQSGESRFVYYSNLNADEKTLFSFLLLFGEKELALHKLLLQSQKERVNKLSYFIDGKVSYSDFIQRIDGAREKKEDDQRN